MFYSVQEKMIFPGAATQGLPEAVVPERSGTELVRLALHDGTPIVARFDPTPIADVARAPTILLFYGNGQCAATTGGVIYLLQRAGCNVLTPDYPGYGMSGGKPSEKSFYAAADVMWAHLNARQDIDARRLYIMGWSLGGGVAIDLASRVAPQGLITVSAFTSVTDMGKRVAPMMPISWILKHPFASIDKIDRVSCPILLIHGERDSTILADMTRRLATKAKSDVKLLMLADSDHNDIFDGDGPRIARAIATFVHDAHAANR